MRIQDDVQCLYLLVFSVFSLSFFSALRKKFGRARERGGERGDERKREKGLKGRGEGSDRVGDRRE